MLSNEQAMAVLGRVSTGRMLALAADLEALDRSVGGPDLELACERLATHLGGAQQVELRTYACGSEHKVLGWSRERRPYTEEAELWLVGSDGSETLICRRSDNPACTMGAFRSTRGDGEVFDVVDVGFGTRPTDYRGHRMQGKVALVSGHQLQAAMLEALEQRQAEGLLCGPGTAGDPTHVVPNRLANASLFSPHRPFGFNLSAHQFNLLGNLLASGSEVQVRVRIRTVMDTGTIPVLSGMLEGGELRDQRVLLVADLGRAASPLGAACLVEILRTLSALVVEGTLSPPQRGLQLLLVPDDFGLVSWLDEQREIWRQIKAVVRLDLPSADAASRVEVQCSPSVQPTFISDLLDDHLQWASSVPGSYRGDVPMQVVTAPYDGSSMLHSLVDRSVGLPSVGVRGSAQPSRGGGSIHGPLHRLTAALAWAAVDLCNLRPDQDLPRLLASSQLKGLSRLTRRAEQLRGRIRDELNHERATTTAARHLLWTAQGAFQEDLRRERQILQSCGDYADGPGQLALDLAQASAGLERVKETLMQALVLRIGAAVGPRARLVPRRRRISALERRAGSVVVSRRSDTPVPLPSLLRDVRDTDRSWLAHNMALLAQQPPLLQRVDGERTLLEIYDQLSFDHPGADLKLLWRYLELLEGAGHVELKEVPTVFHPGEDDEE